MFRKRFPARSVPSRTLPWKFPRESLPSLLDQAVPEKLPSSVSSSAPNDPPAISSTPRQRIGLGATYLYQVDASDPNGDVLHAVFEDADAVTSYRVDPDTGRLEPIGSAATSFAPGGMVLTRRLR